jgi:hypothetical protein
VGRFDVALLDGIANQRPREASASAANQSEVVRRTVQTIQPRVAGGIAEFRKQRVRPCAVKLAADFRR